jgi:hypothetical protein
MLENSEHNHLKERENANLRQREHREKLTMDKARFEKQWAKKEKDSVGRFEDKGMRDVQIAEVKLPRKDELDAVKHTRARELSKDLPEVQSRLKQGWTKDQFSELWNSQNETDRRIARSHDSFFGHDRIKLTKDGNQPYDITNGRHRLYTSNELGHKSVPAHVHERRAET